MFGVPCTGEVIEVLQEDVPEMGEGWHLGRVDSKHVGFFPANYATKVDTTRHGHGADGASGGEVGARGVAPRLRL